MNTPSLTALPNGLRIVTVPCEAESVAFGLFVASGSRHEPSAKAGISHFIEHMLFKGTPTRTPLEITRSIEGRGGNFNACTGEEATCFHAHLPSECLDEAVDIISDMYLRATIPEDEFEREKQVVIEEIKMYADEPDSVAAENLQRALFPKNPLGAPVGGSEATLRPLKPVDLRRYIDTHYLAKNTIAVIVGAFDPAEGIETVRKYLGGNFRRRAKPFSAVPFDGRISPVPEVSVDKEVHQTQLALGYRTSGMQNPAKYALSVLDAVLGRGMSSRLFQEVREKRGLSYDIASRSQLFDDVGMFTVTAGVDSRRADKALATIDRELRRVCERRVGAAELKRTKDFLIGNFRLSHEKVVSKLYYYGATALAFGRLVAPSEQVDGIAGVSAAFLQQVAQTTFRPENRSLSRVIGR